MRTKKFSLMASCLMVLSLYLAGCATTAAPTPVAKPTADTPRVGTSAVSPTTAPTAPSPTAKAAAEPRRGGILTRTNSEDPPNLDIHQATSLNAHLSLANVYNGLVRFDTDDVNKVVPDLAEKWEASPDGRTYTFHLAKGVKWHDGKDFTSEDAKFALERMAFWKDYKIISPRAGELLSAVAKVEAPDPLTVVVGLKYPSPSFIDNAAAGWVLMLPKHVIQAKGDMKKDAVGTGPFTWKTWAFGVSIELARNADYFRKGLPYLDGVTIYTIRDDATRFAAFRTGRVKMTTMASKGLSSNQLAIVKNEMSTIATAITYPCAARYAMLMNFGRKPWDDIRVRQAVDLAFDRQAAIAVNGNVGELGAAMHPKGVWGLAQEEVAKRPGYRQPKEPDIAAAKSRMAEAGYPQGFKTRLLLRGGTTTEQQAVVARDQLAKIGIEATLDVKDVATSQDLLNRHEFDLSPWLLSEPLDDPDTIFSGVYLTGGSKNSGQFSDKDIDDMFKKQAALLDQKERKKVVLDMQQRLLDLVVYPIIFWDAYNMGFWKEVRGYKPGFGPYSHNNLDHTWLAN